MTAFIIIAAAMVLAATALIALPLLSSRAAGRPATWTVFAVLGVLLLGGAALYDRFSNWNWQAAQAPDSSPQSMVSNLARRLARNPDDLNGWLLLGHSYSVLEEMPLAVRAYERANTLAKGGNVDALMGLAEVLITQDEAQLGGGRAADLIEQALKLAPHHPKALFYGAAAAIQRRDFALARTRFTTLLELNPPANVRGIIEQQIAALNQQLAGGAQPAAGQQQAAPAASAAQDPVAQDAVLRVTITISSTLKLDPTADAPLFVFVRDPRQAGPPLAVKRLSARFPQTVELSSADAMIAGHGMTPGQDVEVVARISRGGGPTAQSGDPFGAVAWHVDHKGAVTVVIDRQMP